MPITIGIEAMSFLVKRSLGNSPSGEHSTGSRWPWTRRVKSAHLLLADGTVQTLDATTDPAMFRRIL
ncbi:MAG: hypothetical protein ACKV0T_29970, partial [Planctomycetales bacterium]